MLHQDTISLIEENVRHSTQVLVDLLIKTGTIQTPTDQDDYDNLQAEIYAASDPDSFVGIVGQMVSSGELDEQKLIAASSEVDNLVAEIKALEAKVFDILAQPDSTIFRDKLMEFVESQPEKISHIIVERYVKSIDDSVGLSDAD